MLAKRAASSGSGHSAVTVTMRERREEETSKLSAAASRARSRGESWSPAGSPTACRHKRQPAGRGGELGALLEAELVGHFFEQHAAFEHLDLRRDLEFAQVAVGRGGVDLAQSRKVFATALDFEFRFGAVERRLRQADQHAGDGTQNGAQQHRAAPAA